MRAWHGSCIAPGMDCDLTPISIAKDPLRLCMIIEAALVLFVWPTAGFGQESSAQDSQGPDSTVLEEITVYGRIPLTALRVEVYRAEDNYFAAFNELNSTDEFDIRCVWEAPIGTHIKQRVCEAGRILFCR